MVAFFGFATIGVFLLLISTKRLSVITALKDGESSVGTVNGVVK